jgi:2-dehydro-3-deoxy-D-arabinonate dehydratase
MYLTRHQTAAGPRWALDGRYLPAAFTLGLWLELDRPAGVNLLAGQPTGEPAAGSLLPPIEPLQEVWASGVTYQRSREARQAESSVADVYGRVYTAERPELFFKAIGWRVVGHAGPVCIRRDSRWNVPEPELTLVINRGGQVVGFCAGNDMSSRDIEGENPLYLPQAKIYNGSCALGPGLLLAEPAGLTDLPVRLAIVRGDALVVTGETRTSRIVRPLESLAAYLTAGLDFPQGVFLMTGTGIVPPVEFTLNIEDVVRVMVGDLSLENTVQWAR